MEELVLICPARGHRAYRIAAEEFGRLSDQVAGRRVRIRTDREISLEEMKELPEAVLLGNDGVNHLTTQIYMEGKLEDMDIRSASDDYGIKSLCCGDCSVLVLTGGRPRAALYAVYRYFEVFCGCRWFWDGDRIIQGALPMTDIRLVESPRFEYRGIRYFAHRSLHRFQAEHWSFEEWKTEIHWLLKKRLNLFMLRIGLDDLFQKAFPEIVPYPDRDSPLPEAGPGFDDRTLFWSLEYRGELRRKILQYAFDCDLMHPEDCGTMTHWYSRTPLAYLEAKKPALLTGQTTEGYSQQTGLVWDIREDENLENYFKLTQTHIEEYGRPELFHTIGLAERMFSEDKDENLRLKLNVYRRISAWLEEKYPNAPLLLASWDLWMYYTPKEVKKLIAQLNPSQVILLDYTSDTQSENNFTNWGVVGKFPWIFGIFEGYEPNNELRGDYELMNQRLRIAKDDAMCKGFILWPELSHGDTFCGEFLAYHGWEADVPAISQMVDKYCEDRYREADAPLMKELWNKLMPIVELSSWSKEPPVSEGVTDLFENIVRMAKFSGEISEAGTRLLSEAERNRKTAAEILLGLGEMVEPASADELLRRDLFDMARTVVGRYVNFGIMHCERVYGEIISGQDEGGSGLTEMDHMMRETVGLLESLADLLSLHDDYSMYASLKRLESVTDTNPNFEMTLKRNGENFYCRSYIFENVRYLYVPEMKIVFEEVRRAATSRAKVDREGIGTRREENRKVYYSVPLAEMKPRSGKDIGTVLKESAANIQNMKF